MESLLIVDKPTGPTSFDVVRKIKRAISGMKVAHSGSPSVKVGHTGSLDPFASGCLVLLTGKATKLSQALLDADKKYVALVKLGTSTDSMDRTGNVTEEKAIPEITEAMVQECLRAYEGTWLQTPPMYSAKKINGVRLYQLARKNIEVERAQIPVQLYSLKLLRFDLPTLEIEVHCSKGTYVRSLADDLGKRLGTVAHLQELRRLSCGEFSLEDSVTIEQFSSDPEAFLKKGFQNYVRLVRLEALRRQALKSQSLPPPFRPDDYLPSHSNGGNSLLH